jgi:Gram-negative bacterial TonB protein C-terminal
MTVRTLLAIVVLGAALNCMAVGDDSKSVDKSVPKVLELIVGGYPPLARQARIQGAVTAVVEISEDGAVSSIADIEGPSLLRGATASLKMWRFDVSDSSLRRLRITMRFVLSGPEDVRNVLLKTKVTLPYLIEITTNPTSEKPGPNVK